MPSPTTAPAGATPPPARAWPVGPRWLALAVVAVLTLGLGGCALMRVDNQVQSRALWPSGAALTGEVSYRFERLPSQQDTPQTPTQDELEAWVAAVLAPHGWQLRPERAAWRVSVSASHIVLPRAPWESPSERWRMGFGLEGSAAPRLGLGLWLSLEQPYHLRALSIVVRDGARGEVVYETTARHDGRWNHSPALWQAIIQAALSGFPHPPPGPRQVDLDIPR